MLTAFSVIASKQTSPTQKRWQRSNSSSVTRQHKRKQSWNTQRVTWCCTPTATHRTSANQRRGVAWMDITSLGATTTTSRTTAPYTQYQPSSNKSWYQRQMPKLVHCSSMQEHHSPHNGRSRNLDIINQEPQFRQTTRRSICFQQQHHPKGHQVHWHELELAQRPRCPDQFRFY